jgi:hypothetical protein
VGEVGAERVVASGPKRAACLAHGGAGGVFTDAVGDVTHIDLDIGER